MVALVVTNEKLRVRALSILEMATSLSLQECADALDECSGDTQVALVRLMTGNTPETCRQALIDQGSVRAAVGILLTDSSTT